MFTLAGVSLVGELLDAARDLYRRGAAMEALEACERAAAEARRTGDVAALADAATIIRTTSRAPVADRVHELCVEALARLGDADPVRTARVRAQLVATTNPFGPADPLDLDLPPESDDAESAFLRLQAWHAARLAVDHLPERLMIAGQAVDLGRRTGKDEYTAWGRRWRMDAYAVLGDRVNLLAELQALQPLVARLGSPSWQAYVFLVESSQLLLDGRFDEALKRGNDAVAVEADPDGEAAFWWLTFASTVAEQAGRDVSAIIQQVRTAVDGLPYLARGWTCQMLMANGQREETGDLWRSIAPHVTRLPARAPEHLVAAVGQAAVCSWLGDDATARVIYDSLAPYAGLNAVAYAGTPYGGPVDLALGRAAATFGDQVLTRRHLTAALSTCEALHALPFQALTLAELGALGDRSAAARARTLASRLGMRPLLARLEVSLDHPLTRREAEIAALVADGLSNAGIGRRLSVSERTVENHVSHILHKLQLSSRAGIASWHVGQGR
jgi:DNA-binding CsgD family transcriptional regulator